MSGRRVAVKSDGEIPLEAMIKDGVRDRPDVSALASLDKNKMYVLIWHYHDDDVPGPDAAVEIKLSGFPVRLGGIAMREYRIDANNSNAFTTWKKMGSPQCPSPLQIAELEKVGRLAELGKTRGITVSLSSASVGVTLPRQAVSLLVFEW